ncbi:MAG: hypothetical protein ABFE08_02765 [Armatimonadia bacterium]
MYPPPLWLMIAFVIAVYLAAYGPGRLLCRLAGLRLGSAQERLGVACAVGLVILGWVGYLAAMNSQPWLATGFGWLAIGLGAGMVVWDLTRGREACDLQRSQRLVFVLAVLVGLLFTAAMNWGQIRYLDDGSLAGRFVWPDLLYRNAVLSSLMDCAGRPDWPWLAGVPMKGMSLLRFTALLPVMKALGISSNYYQVAALWLGLFGVPVAACCALALYRALGATAAVAATATLLTAFLGNPRWLLNDRFAHSPALHWAGTDIFAVAVPVLLTMLALLVLAVRERQKGAIWLSLLMLVSGLGHVPWLGLAVYVAMPLWLVICLIRRQDVGLAATLTAGALLGIVVLKLFMGTGTGGGSPLAAIGPSPTIRALSWAFPFLSEPLSPLLANPSATSALKLLKFLAVYPIAVIFYLLGSLWVRSLVLLAAHRFPWRRLAQPEYLLGLCLVTGGVLLSAVVDFNKLAYQGAQYDVLRVLWPALLLANLGLAYLLVENWTWLRRRWGLLLLLVLVFYGSWENAQLSLWCRVGLPVSIVSADEMAALRYLDQHASPRDIVLIDPRYQPTPGRFPQIEHLGHNWGYVSGLLNARIWLDNEDMARKFGQGELWDARYAELRRATDGGEAGMRRLLKEDDIRWIIAQGGRRLESYGLSEVFREGEVRVYVPRQ